MYSDALTDLILLNLLMMEKKYIKIDKYNGVAQCVPQKRDSDQY